MAANDPILSWNKSPEAYFMTADEAKKWDRDVASAEDARKFIDEYWRRRGDAFRKQVRTRIEFADSRFGLSKISGSQTAMGRVWMILGAPNQESQSRGASSTAPTGGADPLANTMQNSPVERGARVTYRWLYKNDRLPKELGRAELNVNFITDTSRGSQYIENPGEVEPYLRRAVEHFTGKFASAATTRAAAMSTARPEAVTAKTIANDPLWNATPSLNGAIFTGDAYVSPRENTFYAGSLFLPKDVTGFEEWKTGLLVTLARDASGQQVVSERKHVDIQSYDSEGNRYVDAAIAVPPGRHDILFALYSPEGTTLLASQRVQVEIPAATVARASKLLLTSHIDTYDSQQELEPFTFVAQKYAVRGDRKFRASDKIGFFTIVANPVGSPNPQLMQKMAFTRDGKSFYKTPLEPAQAVQTGPNTFLVGVTFDPNTFKPGHYGLELQVRDQNAPEGSELRTKGYLLNAEFDVVQ